MPANTSGLRYPSHAVRTLLQRHIAPRDASRGNAATAATAADKGWGMGGSKRKSRTMRFSEKELTNLNWLLYLLPLLYYIYYRRKFRSQTSDNMDRWKAEQGRGREKRKIRREKSRTRKSQKKEDADARKGRKVATHCVFPMICGSGGSKNRLAKAAGAEPAGQMRDEKLHAVVARSTFPSQNVQSTPCSDHFWKLRCRKSARRCGVKHMSKWKCTKNHHGRTTFGSWDVEKVHAVVARSTFPSQNVQSTPCSDHFWKLRCRKSARRCGAKHVSKSKC